MPQPQESCMNSILATCAQLKNSLKRLMEPLARQQGVNMAQMLLLCGIHSGVIANVNSCLLYTSITRCAIPWIGCVVKPCPSNFVF